MTQQNEKTTQNDKLYSDAAELPTKRGTNLCFDHEVHQLKSKRRPAEEKMAQKQDSGKQTKIPMNQQGIQDPSTS